MRRLSIIIALLTSLSSTAQKKLALIVAVGNYMPGSNISSIASINDIKYIKAVLKNNGFPPANIATLENARATKKAILTSLDALAIKAMPGDVVLLHFSMHGQQIRDQREGLGKDEDDGYDEALVPYDVKKPQYFPGVYTGENHLRDDELGPKLIALRNKLGNKGSLLVLIDACHSGTATRATEFAVSRGEPVPFLDPENPLQTTISFSAKDNFFDHLSDTASNMVVISGSGPHQQNLQTDILVNGKKESVGSLTYGFYKAMNGLEKGSNYETLFQNIKAFIQAQHPTQIPLVEGNTSQIVFSGRYTPKKETIYLGLADVYPPNDSIFKIDKGMMDGIGEGTTVKIFSALNNKFVADGKIERAEHFVAYGSAQKPLQKGMAYTAIPDAVSYGPFSASLKIKRKDNDDKGLVLVQQLQQLIKQNPFLSIAAQADLMIEIANAENGGQQLQLVDVTDSVRWNKYLQPGDSLLTADGQELMTAIKMVMRSKYLRTLPDGGALAKFIKAQIIPAGNHTNQTELTLTTGEDYSLKIVNSSSERLFYTVLDITPDNKIDILYPTKNKEAANYLIEKKSEVTRKLGVSTNTPFGKEFLKIIISKEPLDLRSVLEHRRQRAEMTSFQEALDDLFADTPASGTRNIAGIKAEEIGIVTVSFTVKKQ